MSNISINVAALGDWFTVWGVIFISIPGRGKRLAKADEVLVELWREIGGGPDHFKGSSMTGWSNANDGVYVIGVTSVTDPDYLPCGPGHNYYIQATHQLSGAAVRQDFVLNIGFVVTDKKPLFLRHEGSTMPADFT